MTVAKTYWESVYKTRNENIRTDNWLNKYIPVLKNSQNKAIVDLGCGWGNNIRSLKDLQITPIACDLSECAIRYIKETYPDVPTKCFDMSEVFPFETNSVSIIIADLTLHYFDTETTFSIIGELNRILESDGYILCRLNSTKEICNKGIISSTGELNYFYNEGITRRFFDQNDINRFFSINNWESTYCQEYEMDRYAALKWLWEIAFKKK